jgi:hypothetical protein
MDGVAGLEPANDRIKIMQRVAYALHKSSVFLLTIEIFEHGIFNGIQSVIRRSMVS